MLFHLHQKMRPKIVKLLLDKFYKAETLCQISRFNEHLEFDSAFVVAICHTNVTKCKMISRVKNEANLSDNYVWFLFPYTIFRQIFSDCNFTNLAITLNDSQ